MSESNLTELELQIATAHRYPRSLAHFKQRAMEMATSDFATAESCLYVRPLEKDALEIPGAEGAPRYTTGLSIRLAEIVGAAYGNLRVGATIIDQTPRHIVARGYAHDLETNFAASAEIIEPTLRSNGEPCTPRQASFIAKAAQAKALRDAIFKVVPRALCKPIELHLRRHLESDPETLQARRQAALEWAQKQSIPEDRIWAALSIAGPTDLTPQHLLTLTALRTALAERELTPEEAFPPQIQAAIQPPAALTPDAEAPEPAESLQTRLQHRLTQDALPPESLLSYLHSRRHIPKAIDQIISIPPQRLKWILDNWLMIKLVIQADQTKSEAHA